jgi:hypothetical protein
MSECSVIEVLLVDNPKKAPSISCCMQSNVPEPIQLLLTEFSHLFAEPVDLPPSRSCDHSIPLIEGS